MYLYNPASGLTQVNEDMAIEAYLLGYNPLPDGNQPDNLPGGLTVYMNTNALYQFIVTGHADKDFAVQMQDVKTLQVFLREYANSSLWGVLFAPSTVS